MSTEPIRLAVVVGSVRKGRFAPTVANWLVERLQGREDYQVDLIDLVDFDLPNSLTDEFSPEVGEKLGALDERLTAAEAFVVITPEYNHSYPAVLKSFIDWHFTHWQAKPIALVSYGGMAGGLRSVEHLRQVFAELHAVAIRDTVSFYNYSEQFDENGTLKAPDGPNAAAETVLDQLAWWALALREARQKRPFKA